MGSSLSDGESVPTAVDGDPREARTPADDHETLLDAKGQQSFLDLSEQLGTLDDPDFDARYELGEVLGRGGMGEVRLSIDRRMGRTVAVKVIRPDGAKRPRLRARFLFEAKMQGQLEHPSIVPVYDLGVRPDGSEYFTMRRVRGRTLHDVLKALRVGERGATVTFTRRRLLAAIQSVCLAIEFAHRRGAVHRDLKPANVMLGEFGEVIVLDWGLAKLLQQSEPPTAERQSLDDVRSLDNTGVGEVLGSPGYMSPEQAVDSQSVGPASDIFALGAILFECLTRSQLITGESHADITRVTVAGQYDARIGKRFPDLDVPPELEEICVTATAFDPRQRYARARDLADAIERFLEGDRDVARRRAMAGRHTRAAITALAESAEAKTSDATKAARSRAIREVSHALAIDPQNQTALRAMMKIVTDAPSAVADEAEAALREKEIAALRTAARRGSRAYLALATTIAAMGLLGVESIAALGAACGCFLAAAAVTRVASRGYPTRADRLGRVIAAVIALSSCGIAASCLLFGPLVYAPSLCAANVVVFAAAVSRRFRWLALACGLAAVALPLLLEMLGVITPGWSVREGAIAILPRAVRFSSSPLVMGLLGIASLGTVLFPALLVGAERDARIKAERELYARTQTLAELVPAEAGEALSVRPSLRPPPG
ncbi:Serine/threonine protein kinase PrkC, regulator of stationary phase [Minicystis rosea]|nr:Serine/threonine protein kinase PrkC, regulator of stationary phase [Minicystis rosea]